MRVSLLITVVALGVAVVARAEERPMQPGSLDIMAQGLDGSVVGGVRFGISINNDAAKNVVTNDLGMVREAYTTREDQSTTFTVTLEDDRFRLLSLTTSIRQAVEKQSSLCTVRLYKTDPRELTEAERAEYVRALPEIHRREREATNDLPGLLRDPTALRLCAFLAGSRIETASVSKVQPATGKDAAAVIAQVTDRFGKPQPRVYVSLLTQEGDSGKVRIVDAGATKADGTVRFEGLGGDRFYRAEVLRGPLGTSARSPVVLIHPGEAKTLRPLVLREAGRVLSGIVIDGNGPATGMQITTGGEHQRKLTTTTDKYGYFELAPLESGSVTLSIRRLSDGEEATMTALPGRDELIVPFSVLTLPARREDVESPAAAAPTETGK